MVSVLPGRWLLSRANTGCYFVYVPFGVSTQLFWVAAVLGTRLTTYIDPLWHATHDWSNSGRAASGDLLNRGWLHLIEPKLNLKLSLSVDASQLEYIIAASACFADTSLLALGCPSLFSEARMQGLVHGL
jgi:hypothetical protein